LNELKEISSISPNGENSEFFQCEADPHHQNLVFLYLINIKKCFVGKIATITNTDITFNDLREKKSEKLN